MQWLSKKDFELIEQHALKACDDAIAACHAAQEAVVLASKACTSALQMRLDLARVKNGVNLHDLDDTGTPPPKEDA